ncbi:hypothetical protein B0H66DRAFT_299255 [Apodospora peruviana]|uniref:Uncharacterized protein n=1 Tax=Apodospora peruviana TaxID=516989 RepID=A0AAE0I164_9PEZI|nr:hypothetical protein B0H66DRAFT_299255 [Apodospora peruviana]
MSQIQYTPEPELADLPFPFSEKIEELDTCCAETLSILLRNLLTQVLASDSMGAERKCLSTDYTDVADQLQQYTAKLIREGRKETDSEVEGSSKQETICRSLAVQLDHLPCRPSRLRWALEHSLRTSTLRRNERRKAERELRLIRNHFDQLTSERATNTDPKRIEEMKKELKGLRQAVKRRHKRIKYLARQTSRGGPRRRLIRRPQSQKLLAWVRAGNIQMPLEDGRTRRIGVLMQLGFGAVRLPSTGLSTTSQLTFRDRRGIHGGSDGGTVVFPSTNLRNEITFA